MASQINVDFRKTKGVVAKKRFVEIDGVKHEMAWGTNQLPVSPGEHRVSAHMVAPLGNKIAPTKPLSIKLEDGQSADLVYHLVGSAFSKEFRLEIAGQEAPPPAPLPAWAWVFIIACIAIPVVALGGGIPVALGVLGAGCCAMAAKTEKLAISSRVLICLLIAVACWATFILIISFFLSH